MSNYFFKPTISIIIISMIVGFVSFDGYAQSKDSLLKVYNTQTIHTYGKFFLRENKKLSFRDLKPELNAGISKALYRKAKINRFLGGTFTVTSLGAFAASLIVRKNNTTLANVLSGFAIGLNLGSIHFRNRSTESLDRAIWYRNREILFGK